MFLMREHRIQKYIAITVQEPWNTICTFMM
jgi:hypothetical protein